MPDMIELWIRPSSDEERVAFAAQAYLHGAFYAADKTEKKEAWTPHPCYHHYYPTGHYPDTPYALAIDAIVHGNDPIKVVFGISLEDSSDCKPGDCECGDVDDVASESPSEEEPQSTLLSRIMNWLHLN